MCFAYREIDSIYHEEKEDHYIDSRLQLRRQLGTNLTICSGAQNYEAQRRRLIFRSMREHCNFPTRQISMMNYTVRKVQRRKV